MKGHKLWSHQDQGWNPRFTSKYLYDLWDWSPLQYVLCGNCIALCGFYPRKIVKAPKYLHNSQWSVNFCPTKQPHSFTQMLQEAVVGAHKSCTTMCRWGKRHVHSGGEPKQLKYNLALVPMGWIQLVRPPTNDHGSKLKVLILIHRKVENWLIVVLAPELQLWWWYWGVRRHKTYVSGPSVQET